MRRDTRAVVSPVAVPDTLSGGALDAVLRQLAAGRDRLVSAWAKRLEGGEGVEGEANRPGASGNHFSPNVATETPPAR